MQGPWPGFLWLGWDVCRYLLITSPVPTQMRQNLHAAMDILGGEAPRDLPEGTALAAWQTLFSSSR
jgi:hypothetical protein